jgi:hypothetical protein
MCVFCMCVSVCGFRASPLSSASMAYCPLNITSWCCSVSVLGWYPWVVICSRVCALANEIPAPCLCACVSPPTITALGCVVRVLFCVRVLTLTPSHSPSLARPLHFLPRSRRCLATMTHRTLLDAPPRWCADPRLTCSTPRPIDAERNTNVRCTVCSCVPPLTVPPMVTQCPSRHPVVVFFC